MKLQWKILLPVLALFFVGVCVLSSRRSSPPLRPIYVVRLTPAGRTRTTDQSSGIATLPPDVALVDVGVSCGPVDQGGHPSARCVALPSIQHARTFSQAASIAVPDIVDDLGILPDHLLLLIHSDISLRYDTIRARIASDWDAVKGIVGCALEDITGNMIQFGVDGYVGLDGEMFGVNRLHGFSVSDERITGVVESESVSPMCLMTDVATWMLHAVPVLSNSSLALVAHRRNFAASLCQSWTDGLATLKHLDMYLPTLSEVGISVRGLQDEKKDVVKYVSNIDTVAKDICGHVRGLDVSMRPSLNFPSLNATYRRLESLQVEMSRNSDVILRSTRDKMISEFVLDVGNALHSVLDATSRSQRDVHWAHYESYNTTEDEMGWHLCSRQIPCHVSSFTGVVGKGGGVISTPSYALGSTLKGIKRHQRNRSQHFDLRVVWSSWCCHCCGFSNEITHILHPLSRLVNVYSAPAPECYCSGFPTSVTDTLYRVYTTEQEFARARQDSDVVIWVSHTDPESFESAVWKSVRPSYIIGRAMFEFTRIPLSWVEACNKHSIGELWVPSRFVRDVFEQSGVKTPLHIVPEAVDPFYWDARVHARLRWNSSWRFSTNDESVSADPHVGRRFIFLSVFKWEPRKGWDVLLEAYCKSFQHTDRVSLYLLTRMWYPGPPHTWGDPHNATHILEIVQHYMVVKCPVDPPNRHPHVVIVTEPLPESEMVKFYAMANAFVLPSRGEGWGLPVMQALSMRLPVITTRWSGMLDYLTDSNAFLVDIDGLEDVPESAPYVRSPGSQWARPSLAHLRALLKHVHTNTTDGVSRGRRGRRTVIEQFSEEVVARTIAQRLVDIKRHLRAGTVARREVV